jgi:carbonic anhydrase
MTKRTRYSERFAALAHGQEPAALFVTCSDSRVVPSLVSLSKPGELFVVRNIANIIPPSSEAETADASAASAVWYALEVLKINDVIVCGHSGCGGIKAALAGPPPFRPLQRWLAPAARAVAAWRERGPLDPNIPDFDQVSQISTLQQLENLESYDHVRAKVESGDVRLHAWWFDIPTARLLAYSKESRRYVPIMEAFDEIVESAAQ